MTSLYGNYRNRTFSDIFPSYSDFYEEAKECPLTSNLAVDGIQQTFYLLYANYGNSVIASSDETQFKYQLFGVMFDNTGAWQAKIKVQNALLSLSEDEIRSGYVQISNHAYNPSTEPAADAMDPLSKIDDQVFNGSKKGKLESYAMYWDMIKANLSKAYMAQFRKLFMQIVEPEEPLWYVTDDEEEDE